MDIYRFVKKVIENGIENKLSEEKVLMNIDILMNNLKKEHSISNEDVIAINSLKRYIKIILNRSITVDEAYIEILRSTLITNNDLNKEKEESKVYTIGSCLKERKINTENRNTKNYYDSYENTSSSCGSSRYSSSYSSSCGIDRYSSRC